MGHDDYRYDGSTKHTTQSATWPEKLTRYHNDYDACVINRR